MQPSSLAPHQQRARAELPNRVPCPPGAFIIDRIALQIGFQVPYSFLIALGGSTEQRKLIEGVHVALRSRSGVSLRRGGGGPGISSFVSASLKRGRGGGGAG